ncbi:DsbA family protein [Rhodoligotrophos defluvii]|uniref:DsbA family protein n=1 Tax=Rhodoligotrophos defluvii TaxID=2561934 RepID=UPI0010CA0D1A|nr:DsbA family protein [Rhodoligotrophos defluvii]
MHFARRLLTAVSLACLLAVPAMDSRLSAAEFNDAQRGEIIETIRQYLLENPEFLREVIQALDQKEQQQQLAQAADAIKENAKAIFRDEKDFVAGNPEGDVTVVEFFDYNCGYCKRSQPDLMALLKQDKNVRFVLKEFPILGPGSLVAAKAAIAAKNQDKYWEFHNALMAHNGSLDEAAVFATAKKVGLDLEKLKADMQGEAVTAQIEDGYRLARELGIQGTPAFVIGDKFLPGAVGLDALTKTVAEVRGSGSCKALC